MSSIAPKGSIIRNCFLCVILLMFLSLNGYAQKPLMKFQLVGKINLDSGLIKLVPLDSDGSRYYPINTIFESKIENGNFNISGEIPYTLAYKIFITVNSELKDISDVFYIDTGVQHMNYDINKLRSIPNISNKTMQEYAEHYVPILNNNRDSALLNYSKSYPDSYISLWQIVNWLEWAGPSLMLENIYNNLSVKIKNTYTGLKIEEKLKLARAYAIGQKFPTVTLFDSNIKKTQLSIEKKYKGKIVLVDFWFSHCNPCISQFPELIRLYKEYHSKGFEIIGISVDDKPLINDWKNIIQKFKLPWIQNLDLKGVEAKKLSVVSYPSNFLLDQKGIIVAKKIGLKELENYLKESLK